MNNLNEAEEFGKLLFTEKEIHLMLSESPIDLKSAILRGQLIADAEIRKVIIQQAKSGSGEAQKIVEQWKSRIRFENAIKK